MLRPLIFLLLIILSSWCAHAQVFDEAGNDVSGMTGDSNRNNGRFNPHSKDSTSHKKNVPKGIYVWTVDRKFGDIRPTVVDTLPHLFTHTTLNTGREGQYNTTGNNYTARENRIFMDRPAQHEFALTDAYSYVNTRPDEWHFTNTLSPITNVWYDNCGDKNYGEDHFKARFAVNAGKKTGIGFDINYTYARGYYQNQATSHFLGTIYGSHLGDRYQLHALFTIRHQKATESGGITNDNYITHPELFNESYAENEIPSVLTDNWNRDHNQHFFLTHRYSVGFYRDVPMTEEEIKARDEARKQQQLREQRERAEQGDDESAAPQGRPADSHIAAGRPAGAKIAGDMPARPTAASDSIAAMTDTTRISVTSKEQQDSILAQQALQDSIADNMKKEYVPVTSFIHTVEFDNYEHIYQAYQAPRGYYANTYFATIPDGSYPGDSIYDMTRHMQLRNTLAVGMLEGFNKWAKAGIKAFATHQYRRYDMPTLSAAGTAVDEHWSEHNISVGGMISKTQGRTLHYNLMGELWLTGEDAGQLKLDFATDLNFPLFGDTVTLAAKAYFYRLNPDFFFRHYHSKHFWWDNSLSMTTRTRVEGSFRYEKSNTSLRVSIEEMQNYTHLGMSYDYSTATRANLSAQVMQHSSNLHVLTAQFSQPLALGPLHFDNIVTYQSTSDKDILPLPALNIFSNLYLRFRYAGVLTVELGAAATYFTKYYAPDFCPQLNQYAVQTKAESKVEMGNQPFVDVYANLHLKHARFFVMMTNVTGNSMTRNNFLTAHYPQNTSVLHFGVSWNFFN